MESKKTINVLFDNLNSVHESCFKNILVVNDLVLKKKCMEKTNIFFYDKRRSIYSCKMQSIDN